MKGNIEWENSGCNNKMNYNNNNKEIKSKERQNQMEEFLLKSLNCTKAPENDITMYSTIETFEYVPENDKTFDTFYKRYEDVFNVDSKEWSNEKRYVYYSGNWVQLNTVGSLILSFQKKAMGLEFSVTVKLLSELFGPNTSLLHKKWKCLNIFKDDQQDYLTFAATVNKHCNDFKLADITADDFKCLIFAQGLVSAEDAESRRRVLTKLENKQGLTLKKLAKDCQRVVSVKSDSKTIEESEVAHIKKSRANRHAIPHKKGKVELRD